MGNIVKLEGGAYSDYWEHWYSCEEPMTHEILGKRIIQYAEDAEKLVEIANTAKWDEGERLFGVRTHIALAYHPKLKEIYEWKNHYPGNTNYENILMALCGLTRIIPHIEVGCGIYLLKDSALSVGKELCGQ